MASTHKTPEHSPNWGGTRKGAGRKRQPTAPALSSQGSSLPFGAGAGAGAVAVSHSGHFELPSPSHVHAHISQMSVSSQQLRGPSAAQDPLFDPLLFIDAQAYAGSAGPIADEAPQTLLDLNLALCKNRRSSFVLRVVGDSMQGCGIYDGDYLIVDRSVEPRSGHVVVAYIPGRGMTVKRLRQEKDTLWLDPSNPQFSSIAVKPDEGVVIWGVAVSRAGAVR